MNKLVNILDECFVALEALLIVVFLIANVVVWKYAYEKASVTNTGRAYLSALMKNHHLGTSK